MVVCRLETYIRNIHWKHKMETCFQSTICVSNLILMFPIYKLCFQYPMCVSYIQFMFPNSNDVSNVCFQFTWSPFSHHNIISTIYSYHKVRYSKCTEPVLCNSANDHWFILHELYISHKCIYVAKCIYVTHLIQS